MDAIEIFTTLNTPQGRADPYPLYARLHELGEIIDTGVGQVPVQLTSRIGYDTKLCGVPISSEVGVATLLGAGNRDPRRFTDPNRFDPSRTDAGPLSFGGGAHYCIGAALARLEGAVAFPRLFGRFPKIAAAGEPTRRETLLLRGFDSLPITVA